MAISEQVGVLLVEDSALEAQIVLDALASARRPGFNVSHVTRLGDAIESLALNAFDVVVLDLGLPDAQGLDGLARIRPAAGNAAIVVRSGLSDERVALDALESGAQDYIVKGRRGGEEMLERSILYALARRQVEQSSRRLEGLIDSSPDAIYSTDLDGMIATFNVGAEQMFGYPASEAVGLPLSILAPPELADEIPELRARAMRGEVSRLETRRVRCDGTALEVALTVSPVIGVNGRVSGVLVIARDITDSQRDRRQLQAIFDNIPAPLVIRDRAGRYLHTNAYVSRSLGLSPQDLAGRHPGEFYPPDVAAKIRAQDDALLRSREPSSEEITVPHGDGSLHDYHVVKYPILDGHGEVTGFGSVSLDITARKRAEERLQAAEARFRKTFEDAPIGIALVSPDGRFIQVNHALCDMVGHPEPELLELSFQDITHRDDLDEDLEYVRQMLAGEIRTYQMQKRYFHKDGAVIWVKLSVSLVRDANDQPLHFVSQIEDITAAKHADEALREAQSRLRAIFDHLPAGLSLRDVDGRYLQVNNYAARSLGASPEDLVGRHPGDHLDPDTIARVRTQDQQMIRSAEAIQHEASVPSPDGTNHDYHVVSYPVLDDRDNVVALGSFSLDVTERRHAERERERALAQLDEAQQIARVGSWSRDNQTGRVTWSAEMYRIFARSPARGPATGDELLAYVHADDREQLLAEFDRSVAGGGTFSLDYRIVAEDGSPRMLHAIGRRAPNHPAVYIGTVQDVTELRQAEREARRERDYAATITRSMREGFLLTRDGTIIDVNDALCQLTGFTREELIGARVPYPFWAPEAVEQIQRHRQTIATGRSAELETIYARKDGTRVDVSINAAPATSAEGELQAWVSTIRDITEQKRHRAELERLATRDSLTGLLNHRVFHEQLRAEIARAERHHRPLSLVILDLDHFKDINDRHGHPIGDKVLHETAQRLHAMIRTGEHLARVGGEEFAWILPDANSTGAFAAAERARNAIAANPFPTVGTVTLSAGVSELADTNGDPQRLYELADRALYSAKQHGRNQTRRHGHDAHVPAVEPSDTRNAATGHTMLDARRRTRQRSA